MAINTAHYINREMSWLEFNQRVLDQACDANLPLLERLKFLAITSSNLDEFFQVRVGSLQLQQRAAIASTDPSGLSVQQQLDRIAQRASQMIKLQYTTFLQEIEPLLARAGIVRVRMATASVRHLEAAARIMEEELLPVLAPVAVSKFDLFPMLSNKDLYVCVQMSRIKSTGPLGLSIETLVGFDPEEAANATEPYRYAIIPLGRTLSRVVTLPTDSGFSYALLEDVVSHFADKFFPNESIRSTSTFRITRNADVSVQEDNASDLLHGMKELLQQRRTSDYVRLEISEGASDEMIEFLRLSLQVHPNRLAKIPDPIDMASLSPLGSLEGFDHLRDAPWPPQRSPQIDSTQSLFSTIASKDIILFHPFQSFEPVIRLIEEAAEDPDVLAIKQTLYRTSRKSPIVAALRRAAERGKYVTVIVELKARFDEARNIEWAQELEQAGVQVIYGVKYLKTHAKACLIVRREPHGIVRYVHIGTGNYNEITARFYSDFSLLTCDAKLGADVSAFFNAVTGYSEPQEFAEIEVAPLGLRKRLISLIEAEIDRKEQGVEARITCKLNSLVDPILIEALYRASQAGVTVRLNVRGICCLRPGVPGLSENITVVSIVDRCLEHARVMHFYHGGDDLVFVSSADWMPRNLDRRVELLVPVEDSAGKRVCLSALEDYFRDNQNAWVLQPDGNYIRKTPGQNPPFRAQLQQYQAAVELLKEAERQRRSVFEPHQKASESNA
jgi:polyphosphate kinase